jgi:urease accessory protein
MPASTTADVSDRATARAVEHLPAHERADQQVGDEIELSFHDRHRRRLRLVTSAGRDLLLDLDRVVAMRDGDLLRLDDGSWLRVVAAAEELVEVSAADEGSLLRLAWHVGNRHVPAQLDGQRFFIGRDHVIEGMLEGLGATLRVCRRPFDAETGAYHSHAGEGSHAH